MTSFYRYRSSQYFIFASRIAFAVTLFLILHLSTKGVRQLASMDIVEQRSDLQFHGGDDDAGDLGDVQFLRDAQAMMASEYYIGLDGGCVGRLSFDSQGIMDPGFLDTGFQARSL